MNEGHIKYYINILKKYYYIVALTLLGIQNQIISRYALESNNYSNISLLISGATFLSIFRLLIALFDWKIWKLFMKPRLLTGKWYIKFTGIEEKQSKLIKYTRYGHLYVNWNNPVDITITGRNYNKDSSNMTTWEGIVVYLKMNEIKYTYTVEKSKTGKSNRNKEGVYMGIVERNNNDEIVRIIGRYKDDSGINFGETYWTRTPPEGHPELKTYNKYE